MEFLPCGYKINFILLKKINGFQGKWYVLWIDIVWGLQKLGIILENKVPPNLKFAKYDFCESCSSFKKTNKNLFLNNKDDFWHRKLTLKTQNSPISLKAIHLFDKFKLILYPPVKNSIFQLALMRTNKHAVASSNNDNGTPEFFGIIRYPTGFNRFS